MLAVFEYIAACSVHKACDEAGAGPSGAPTGPGAAKVSSSNADICKVFNHVATVCRLDTGMSRMGGGCACFDLMLEHAAAAAMCMLCCAVLVIKHASRSGAVG
jgi:hypothetical protein